MFKFFVCSNTNGFEALANNLLEDEKQKYLWTIAQKSFYENAVQLLF